MSTHETGQGPANGNESHPPVDCPVPRNLFENRDPKWQHVYKPINLSHSKPDSEDPEFLPSNFRVDVRIAQHQIKNNTIYLFTGKIVKHPPHLTALHFREKIETCKATVRNLEKDLECAEQQTSQPASDPDCIQIREKIDKVMDMVSEWERKLRRIESMERQSDQSAASKDETEAGRCYGWLVNPPPSLFYRVMHNILLKDGKEFSTELFDRYRRLHPELLQHPVKRGSAIWNQEVESDHILLIHYIRIRRKLRGHGLGKRLVSELLMKMRSLAPNLIAYVKPQAIDYDWKEIKPRLDPHRRECFGIEEIRIATDFWRSLGFRRIGASGWFGLASAPNHPCHSITASEDFNPPMLPHQVTYPYKGYFLTNLMGLAPCLMVTAINQEFSPVRCHFSGGTYKQLDAEISLLTAGGLTDDRSVCELLEMFRKRGPDHPLYDGVDDDGNSMLHLAALRGMPKLVKSILAQCPRLATVRNRQHDTPMEAVLSKLGSSRTSQPEMPVERALVTCLIHLRGEDVTDIPQEELDRLAYGCTCGQCISGILSVRMRYALLNVAYQFNPEMVGNEPDNLLATENGEFRHNWEERLRLLDSAFRIRFMRTARYRQGYSYLGRLIAGCLHRGGLPSCATILGMHTKQKGSSKWYSAAQSYISEGGGIVPIGKYIFDSAMREDHLTGSGALLRDCGSVIEKLPKCRNDPEFKYVSQRCGYDSV